MAIITLTTDLGTKDFYQAAVKGSILTLLPQAQIVDISHDIEQFNIAHAAFVLKNAFPFFPKNTVHIIGVDSIYVKESTFVLIKSQNQYFIGPDNGIFTLIFEEKPDEIIEINLKMNYKFAHFPIVDVFVKTAAMVIKGSKMDEIGKPLADINRKISLQPIITQNRITGNVIYIDNYKNVITNITQELFEKHQKGRKFTLIFRRNESISSLSWDYNDVAEGEKLCLFGISGHLEIAINKGKAEQLLGLKHGMQIHLEFTD